MHKAFKTALLLILAGLCACSVDHSKESQPVILDVQVAQGELRGDIPLKFMLKDDGGELLKVDAYYLKDSSWNKATPSPAAGSGGGFVASVEGLSHSFVWDSASDMPGKRSELRLKVVAENSFNAAEGQSPLFTLANDNKLPRASFMEIESLPDNIQAITFGVADPEEKPMTVEFEYTSDGGEKWHSATIEGDTEELLNSQTHGVYTAFWDSAADLGYTKFDTVRLRLTAFDDLGPGAGIQSHIFAIDNVLDTSLEMLETVSTLRQVAAISYKLYGNPGSHYSLDVQYSLDNGESFSECSQKIRQTDATKNLAASPDGELYTFFWDTEANLPEKTKTRNVSLRLILLNVEGKPLDNEISILKENISIDNAELVDLPVISEVYLGIDSDSGFIELYGPPDFDLSGIGLVEYRQNGTESGARFSLEGYVIPEDGYAVIAGPDAAMADFTDENFSSFFRYGNINSLVLYKEEIEYTYDALGYGDFGDLSFLGEGEPASAPGLGLSLQRDRTNTDADDNSVDFIIAEPTPGAGIIWE